MCRDREIYSLKNGRFGFFCCVARSLSFLERRESQFKLLLEMCIVQKVKPKSVIALHPIETPEKNFRTTKIAIAAVTCLMIP